MATLPSGGALNIGGSGEFGGEIRGAANARIGGDLQVNGSGDVVGNLHAGAVNADGQGNFGGLHSNHDLGTDGDLTVAGVAILKTSADVTGDMTVGGKFTADTLQPILLRSGMAAVSVNSGQVALQTGGGSLLMQEMPVFPGGCTFTLDTAPASGPPHTIEIGQDGNVFLGKSLNVRLNANLNGNAQVASNLTVNGVFTAFGNSSLGDIFAHEVTSQNDLHAQGGVLAGYATFSGDVTARAYNTTSDRAAKENIMPVDPRAILEKVARLPVSVWNFKSDGGVRHIGPMAQDVYAAFAVGSDDRHIATVDGDGLALAAIQGLNQVVEEKDRRIRALEKDVEELKARMNELTGARQGNAP